MDPISRGLFWFFLIFEGGHTKWVQLKLAPAHFTQSNFKPVLRYLFTIFKLHLILKPFFIYFSIQSSLPGQIHDFFSQKPPDLLVINLVQVCCCV